MTAPSPVGLVLPRLLDVLVEPATRLFFVAAPPGSGKTTLIAHHVHQLRRERPDHRIAWYQADESETSVADVSRHLSTAVSIAYGLEPADRDDPESLQMLLEPADLTVVIDDAHVLADTPAEQFLARAMATAPPDVRFIVVGTREPGTGFARHLLHAGTKTLREVDLRLRSWEVSELFERHYREPLPARDIVALTAHTEGWVAGLHMFHLATAGRSLAERRRALAAPWARGRLVRVYLTATVLDRVPAGVEDFLVRSSALAILDPDLCDALLERHDSAALLAELADRHLFTSRVDDVAGLYRFHPALQGYLETLLTERLGRAGAARWYARAGRLLDDAGEPTRALRAYLRSGDVTAVRRLFRTHGAAIVADPEVPAEALTVDDPWAAVARARRHLSAGDLTAALEAYDRIGNDNEGTRVADLARRERGIVRAWLPECATLPLASIGAAWPLAIRAAVHSQAGLPAPATNDAGGMFAAAAAALLRGEPLVALHYTDQIDVSGHGFVSLATQLLGQLAGVWLGTGTAPAASLDTLAAEMEHAGQPWLVRMTRAAAAVAGGAAADALAIRDQCVRSGDDWGALLSIVAAGVASLTGGGHDAGALFEEAADAAHRLGAGTLEAWARVLFALDQARSGVATAELEARRAEACARRADIRAARAVAFQALAVAADGESGDGEAVGQVSVGEFRRLAEMSAAEHGLPWRARPERSLRLAPDVNAKDAGPVVTVRCFGGFELEVDGAHLDLTVVRPRARAMLRMLASHAGQPVHEERLLDALWPGMTPESGRRNLQVTVSALRKVLEPAAVRGRARLLRRTGPAYVLELPFGSRADVAEFRTAVTAWRAARGGPVDQLRRALRGVLATYGGELLPEDGPAEWAVSVREELRTDAVQAAVALAELELGRRDGMAAAEAAEFAVRLDPYRDQAWRCLLTAHQLRGDTASAAQTSRRYAVMLGQLGLAAPSIATA